MPEAAGELTARRVQPAVGRHRCYCTSEKDNDEKGNQPRPEGLDTSRVCAYTCGYPTNCIYRRSSRSGEVRFKEGGRQRHADTYKQPRLRALCASNQAKNNECDGTGRGRDESLSDLRSRAFLAHFDKN